MLGFNACSPHTPEIHMQLFQRLQQADLLNTVIILIFPLDTWLCHTGVGMTKCTVFNSIYNLKWENSAASIFFEQSGVLIERM